MSSLSSSSSAICSVCDKACPPKKFFIHSSFPIPLCLSCHSRVKSQINKGYCCSWCGHDVRTLSTPVPVSGPVPVQVPVSGPVAETTLMNTATNHPNHTSETTLTATASVPVPVPVPTTATATIVPIHSSETTLSITTNTTTTTATSAVAKPIITPTTTPSLRLLIPCGMDKCRKKYCTHCITKNFDAVETRRVHTLGKNWECFSCNTAPLLALCESKWPDLVSKRMLAASSTSSDVINPDISNGREKIAIPVINSVDDSTPFPFTYISDRVGVSALKKKPEFLSCCSCTDNCADKSKCECAQAAMNNGTFAYYNGLLVNEKPSGIYECNFRCACNINHCPNRVVGKGPLLPLEVFKCKPAEKGWGVRCRVDIPAGSFIADYTGEVIDENVADTRGIQYGDEYLFTLDAYGRSRGCHRLHDLGLKSSQQKAREEFYLPIQVAKSGIQTVDTTESFNAIAASTSISSSKTNAADTKKVDNVFKVPLFVPHVSKGKISEVLGSDIAELIVKSSSVKYNSRTDNVQLLGSVAIQRSSLKGTGPSALSPSKRKNNCKLDETTQSIDGKLSKQKKSKKTVAPLVSYREYCAAIDEDKLKQRTRILAQKEARSIITDKVSVETESLDSTFAIDAKWYGNVGRFLNHSCEPNVEKINVFVDSHDIRLPRVALFSNCFIPKGTELCYDYGYFQGNVEGKHQQCLCGAAKCRKFMY